MTRPRDEPHDTLPGAPDPVSEGTLSAPLPGERPAHAAPGADPDEWETFASSAATAVAPTAEGGRAVEALAFAQRYEPRALLGVGGMGEVRLCKDHLVGR